MTKKNSTILLVLTTILTLCTLPAKAQFEFAPTVGMGLVTDKQIMGGGFALDLGVSARYTFFEADAPVNLQVRLDATYGYIYASALQKNVIQHVRLDLEDDRFVAVWQDNLIRLPLTLGVRFNNVFNSKVTFRAGAYYGRGIGGKVHYFKTPANLYFQSFNSYRSNTIKGMDGYEGNFITLAQNEHRLGVIAAMDINLLERLELSLYYMGDLGDSWNAGVKPSVKPNAFKLALSYWF